jgi:cytochrome P450
VFAEGKEWAKRRKIMSSIFHFSFFETFVPKIISIVDKSLQEIESDPSKTSPLTINSMEFSSKIAGRTVVKSFFGLKFE